MFKELFAKLKENLDYQKAYSQKYNEEKRRLKLKNAHIEAQLDYAKEIEHKKALALNQQKNKEFEHHKGKSPFELEF